MSRTYEIMEEEKFLSFFFTLCFLYLVLTSNVSSFPSNSASAANPYLQTQVGIDLGGKRLADEVEKPLHVP